MTTPGRLTFNSTGMAEIDFDLPVALRTLDRTTACLLLGGLVVPWVDLDTKDGMLEGIRRSKPKNRKIGRTNSGLRSP